MAFKGERWFQQILGEKDLIKRLPYFIEAVYNLRKLHSALEYRSPSEIEGLVLIQENNRTRGPTLLNLFCPIIGAKSFSKEPFFPFDLAEYGDRELEKTLQQFRRKRAGPLLKPASIA